jgi:hypothetical protein
MPRVGFESTTPVFDRVKTVYALDRTAIVSGHLFSLVSFFYFPKWYFRDSYLLETVLEQGL